MKLGEIAKQFQLECRGDPDIEIRGIASLQEASEHQLAFLFSSHYRSLIESSSAAAIVMTADDAAQVNRPVLLAEQPRLAWAHIAGLFDTQPVSMPFVHPTAVISDLARVGKGVAIGAHSTIASGAVIEDGVSIGTGVHIGAGAKIGAGTRIDANCVIYHNVTIGKGCRLFANAVIGADGFGYEFDGRDFVKIPQVYGVVIGDQVDIGAGTTIDRGALNDTVIGDHCKFDNQVQIGHGTRIGDHTVISGCSAIAGSTTIGRYCLIGGGVGIVDNIEVADQVEITAMTLVSQSIREKGRYSSGTGLMPGRDWKRSIVGFRKLDEILKRLRRLEAKD